MLTFVLHTGDLVDIITLSALKATETEVCLGTVTRGFLFDFHHCHAIRTLPSLLLDRCPHVWLPSFGRKTFGLGNVLHLISEVGFEFLSLRCAS